MRDPKIERQPTARSALAVGKGGQLLLWAMRCWLDGRRCWHLVQTEFLASFGLANGMDALDELEGALTILDAHARRMLRLCPEGTLKISPDERLLLQTVEAARAGSTMLLDLGVATLVPRPQQSALARHFGRLARLLDQRDLDCGLRVMA